MVERIRELLQVRQLSPTQFADTIGIARPIVSHILSGRNKPSLEVVQKILAAFPDLSMPWLLSGSGPMQALATPSAAALIREVPVAARRPAAQPKPAVPAPVAREAVATGATAPNAPAAAEATAVPQTPSPAKLPPPATAAQLPVNTPAVGLPPIAELPPLAMLAAPGKAIRRIVIFYTDGSFADYQPE